MSHLWEQKEGIALNKWLEDLQWDINQREISNVKLGKNNKYAYTEKGIGKILSSTPLPTFGDYHIPLRVSDSHTLIGLKSTVEGKNFDTAKNCVMWNNLSIFLNDKNIFNATIKQGIVGISVKARGANMLVQFTRTEDEKVGPEIQFDASHPVYLMGYTNASTKSTVEILTP